MTREQMKEVADRSWGQDAPAGPQPGPVYCRLCEQRTRAVVNINFRAVPLCDRCCLSITAQTVASLCVTGEGERTWITAKDRP